MLELDDFKEEEDQLWEEVLADQLDEETPVPCDQVDEVLPEALG